MCHPHLQRNRRRDNFSRGSESFMCTKNALPLARGLHIRKFCPANPLWPLEELHKLRNPPFVADTESARFDLDALKGDERPRASLSSGKATRCHVSECGKRFKAQFPIPPLVMGLPWRFAKDTTTPIAPDPDFVSFELRYIARGGN
jgi:hypothetical protein